MSTSAHYTAEAGHSCEYKVPPSMLQFYFEVARHSNASDLQSRILFACSDSLTFPSFHVGKRAKLLKQCKTLRLLRLYFARDLIQDMSSNDHKFDHGILELCPLDGIETVEIWDLGREPLKKCHFVEWLKEAIESSEEADTEGERTIDLQSIYQ